MNVLHLNGYESPGQRFNCLNISEELKEKDINSRHLIWERDTPNPKVASIGGQFARIKNRFIIQIEKRLSLQSVLFSNTNAIIEHPFFKQADIVHLHIIHSGFFDIGQLHKITKLKKTVWTLHDPWALTGHCIYPFDCNKWEVGCGDCPSLNIPFPIDYDTTDLLFEYKFHAYKNASFDLIVASNWMEQMVQRSPLMRDRRVHKVPFGLDLKKFHAKHRSSARRNLNISDDEFVLCFRAVNNEFKGLPQILAALELLQPNQNVTLLTMNDDDNCTSLEHKYRIISFGWIQDELQLRDMMAACDVFLMPSMAEAFGVMAIEAMACEKPVVVFEGTALPEITNAPKIGFAVQAGDHVALAETIQNLIDNDVLRRERGTLGRKHVIKTYAISRYVNRLVNIYSEIQSR